MGQPDTLKQLANKRVEVRGTLQQSERGTSGAGAGAMSESGAMHMPALRVTSVRKLADSCTENK
jgi:hypothetical protein